MTDVLEGLTSSDQDGQLIVDWNEVHQRLKAAEIAAAAKVEKEEEQRRATAKLAAQAKKVLEASGKAKSKFPQEGKQLKNEMANKANLLGKSAVSNNAVSNTSVKATWKKKIPLEPSKIDEGVTDLKGQRKEKKGQASTMGKNASIKKNSSINKKQTLPEQANTEGPDKKSKKLKVTHSVKTAYDDKAQPTNNDRSATTSKSKQKEVAKKTKESTKISKGTDNVNDNTKKKFLGKFVSVYWEGDAWYSGYVVQVDRVKGVIIYYGETNETEVLPFEEFEDAASKKTIKVGEGKSIAKKWRVVPTGPMADGKFNVKDNPFYESNDDAEIARNGRKTRKFSVLDAKESAKGNPPPKKAKVNEAAHGKRKDTNNTSKKTGTGHFDLIKALGAEAVGMSCRVDLEKSGKWIASKVISVNIKRDEVGILDDKGKVVLLPMNEHCKAYVQLNSRTSARKGSKR